MVGKINFYFFLKRKRLFQEQHLRRIVNIIMMKQW